jgi:hypothetical protein
MIDRELDLDHPAGADCGHRPWQRRRPVAPAPETDFAIVKPKRAEGGTDSGSARPGMNARARLRRRGADRLRIDRS